MNNQEDDEREVEWGERYAHRDDDGPNPAGIHQLTGRKIQSASLDADRLCLTFTDGSSFELWDDGQTCCEHRYLTTDDDLVTLVGNCVVSITLKPGPDVSEPDDYGCHDTAFLEVQTTGGFVTLVTHNKHNGYYGGLYPRAVFKPKHVPSPAERTFKRRLLSGSVIQRKLLP